MRFWVSLLGAMALASSAVAQNKDGPANTVTISDVQAAQLMISNSRLDEAKHILDHDLASQPDDSELLFLRAMIAEAAKRL